MAETETLEQSLADMYRIDDGSDTVVEPAEPKPEAKPEPKARERGPDGRFLPHSAAILQQAADVGLDPEEIEALPSEAAKTLIRGLAVAQAKEARSRQESREGERLLQKAPPLPPEYQDLTSIKSEDYQDDMKSLIDDYKQLRREFHQLKQDFANVQGVQRSAIVRNQTQQCEDFFAKHPEYYGEGSYEDMDPKGVEMQRRRLVYQAAESNPRNLSKAHAVICPGSSTPEPKKKEKEEYTPEQRRWLEGALEKPTHRTGAPELPSKAKAVRAVAGAIRELESSESAEPTTIDEFLEG